MLHIDNKEFIFTASVLMLPEEVAVLTPPEAKGLVFHLRANRLGAPLRSVEESFQQEAAGSDVTLSFPFLRDGNTMSGEHDVTTSGGVMGLRFAGSCVGTFMRIELHGYWTHRRG